MLIPFPFDAKHHRILDPPPEFLGYLRRRFRRHGPYLFAYKHMLTGAFVVAGWANKQKGRMVDLVNLGSECCLMRRHVRELRLLMEPMPAEELSVERMAQLEREHVAADRRRELEEQEEYLDAKRVYWKHHVKSENNVFFDDVRGRTLVPQPGSARRR